MAETALTIPNRDIVTTAETFVIEVVTRIEADQAVAMQERAEEMVVFAKEFKVNSPADNQEAADHQNRFKKAKSALDKMRKERKDTALQAGRKIDGLFNPTIKLLDEAAREISRPILAYDARVRAARQKEQDRLNAIAEKERRGREAKAQQALLQAQEERRKAEEFAREAERKRQAAEALLQEERRMAEEIQDNADREKRNQELQARENAWRAQTAQAAAEREKMLRKAGRDEARAEMHMEKAETTVAPTVATPKPPRGTHYVDGWVGTITGMKAFVKTVDDNPEIIPKLTMSQADMNRLAAIWQDMKEVNGFKVTRERRIAKSGRSQ